MEDQLFQIVKEKILNSSQTPRPELILREVDVPVIPGKAMVVIGMRRAGKTSFLH